MSGVWTSTESLPGFTAVSGVHARGGAETLGGGRGSRGFGGSSFARMALSGANRGACGRRSLSSACFKSRPKAENGTIWSALS